LECACRRKVLSAGSVLLKLVAVLDSLRNPIIQILSGLAYADGNWRE
jgi:hypothetical protein